MFSRTAIFSSRRQAKCTNRHHPKVVGTVIPRQRYSGRGNRRPQPVSRNLTALIVASPGTATLAQQHTEFPECQWPMDLEGRARRCQPEVLDGGDSVELDDFKIVRRMEANLVTQTGGRPLACRGGISFASGALRQ